ncbi:uncharacterized protein LOC119679519 [Teleopsis dalmanni]|uniref:uncharacterized protein LOC119679519 n=1 Tax=Teleopsis dalmanni TaxID=139649 RepID=UPI0018CD4DBC|nr:uncharacterized protein LOC119679519 [Teleopsis dalmanni]
MKYVSVFFILCLACHLSTPVKSTLTEDLQEILDSIDIKPIKKLVARYEEQIQYFRCVLHSKEFDDIFETFVQDSAVTDLLMYLKNLLEMSLDKFLEMFISDPSFCGSNRSNSVFDWPGFIAEFFAYYPEQLVRSHIAAKVAQNGTFAQLWTRVKAVGEAYNRVMSYPASQVVIAQLEAIGVNTTEIDQFIRTQLDWVNVNTTTPTSGQVVSSVYGPLKYESAIFRPSN